MFEDFFFMYGGIQNNETNQIIYLTDLWAYDDQYQVWNSINNFPYGPNKSIPLASQGSTMTAFSQVN